MRFAISSFLASLALPLAVVQAQDCGTTWKCFPSTTAPTLDADHSDWADVGGITTDLTLIKGGSTYTAGKAVYKCMYDDTHIFFALEIPGEYRFNPENNKQCAAIATMMKVGADATYNDMGGCPDVATPGSCDNGMPDTCDAYLVDIGAHWELRTTEQGVEYGMNATTGSGNDLVANNDDEYGFGSYCRADDDDADAGNEWAGAWKHSDPVDGEMGTYYFELSRLLKTESLKTDGQFEAGETFQFGIAYWDPYEGTEGWTDAGHYVTGCGSNWIDLELATDTNPMTTEAPAVAPTPSGSFLRGSHWIMVLAGALMKAFM